MMVVLALVIARRGYDPNFEWQFQKLHNTCECRLVVLLLYMCVRKLLRQYTTTITSRTAMLWLMNFFSRVFPDHETNKSRTNQTLVSEGRQPVLRQTRFRQVRLIDSCFHIPTTPGKANIRSVYWEIDRFSWLELHQFMISRIDASWWSQEMSSEVNQVEHEHISRSLEVERIETNIYRSKSLWIPLRARGVFGGLVLILIWRESPAQSTSWD